MKKIIAVLLAVMMLASLGALFGTSAAEAPADKLSCGEDAFGAYLTVRENGQDHDARIVLLANEEKLALASEVNYTVSFATEGGNKVTSGKLGANAEVYRSVMAAGKTYEAAEGYVFFGVVVTGIDYSAWQTVSVTINNGTADVTFALDYAKAIRKDMENILGKDAEALYPLDEYQQYYAQGRAGNPTQFFYSNANEFSTLEIRELSLPVAGCEVGDTLTITVSRWAQFQNYDIGDVRGVDNITHTLVAEEACEWGWVTFKNLSISCPYGYSFFVGGPEDTMDFLYLYNGGDLDGVIDPVYRNNYGMYMPINLYGYDSDSCSNTVLTAANSPVDYRVGPFVYTNLSMFSNSVVTSIDLPLYGAVTGQTFTVQVVKFDVNTYQITDVYAEHTLTVYQDVDYHWLSFDVDIYVPEGYTLAFGDVNDTAPTLFLPVANEEFYFYSPSGLGTATLAFRCFGYKCN